MVVAGREPVAVAVGDLDGDDHVDLVAVDKGDSTVTTLLNDGTGGFTVVGSYTTDWVPRGIAVADLNEDGALDVVTFKPGYVSLLLGGGDGTFGPYDARLRRRGYLFLRFLFARRILSRRPLRVGPVGFASIFARNIA